VEQNKGPLEDLLRGGLLEQLLVELQAEFVLDLGTLNHGHLQDMVEEH
jgi:hypothetical protein